MEQVKYLCDVSVAVGEAAEAVQVDEGIGPYEYWGAKYTDRRMVWKVRAGSVDLDITDCGTDERDDDVSRSAIPVFVSATATSEWIDVDFDAWLESVKWHHATMRLIATYQWEGE